MRKKTIAALLIITILLLPLLGWTGLAFFTPSVYHKTFLAELPDKYARLTSIEEQKIVVVGGSSVAFGLNSRQMEEHLNMPVVNFGLYASLGSKVMLDLSKDAVNAGDIVVLAFELDNQTLSMYFNAESMWQAVDCDPSLLFHIGQDDYSKMAGGLYEYVKDKVFFLRNGAPEFEGVYSKSSFDEYGDICYPRTNNIMPSGFDANNRIDLGSICIEEEFSDYVNEYIAYVESRGAKVCYSYCPMNSLALSYDGDSEKAAFVDYLSGSFDCPFISEMDDYIYESEYFYDTNFHLNELGTYFRTRQLSEDLAQYYDMEYSDVKQPVDEPDTKPEQSDDPDTNTEASESTEAVTAEPENNDREDGAEYENCFIYEDYYGAGFAIAGVSEEAKGYTELVIPLYHEGQKVVAIMEAAFEGCDQLEEIRISRGPEDTVTIHDGAFSGLAALERIVLDAEPTAIKVSTEGLLQGVGNKLTFYVNRDVYAKYVTDYYWSIYSDNIKMLDE